MKKLLSSGQEEQLAVARTADAAWPADQSPPNHPRAQRRHLLHIVDHLMVEIEKRKLTYFGGYQEACEMIADSLGPLLGMCQGCIVKARDRIYVLRDAAPPAFETLSDVELATLGIEAAQMPTQVAVIVRKAIKEIRGLRRRL